jgi:hypothetical protein
MQSRRRQLLRQSCVLTGETPVIALGPSKPQELHSITACLCLPKGSGPMWVF